MAFVKVNYFSCPSYIFHLRLSTLVVKGLGWAQRGCTNRKRYQNQISDREEFFVDNLQP